MRLTKKGTRWTGWLAVAVLVCGCGEGGDGLKREAVSGKVTFNGKPLEQGSIQFLPPQGNQNAGAWGQIVNGAYAIAAAEGPVAGEYSVSITSASSSSGGAATDTPPGDDSGLVDPNAIPEQYNLRTTLKATVEAGKANELNYELTSKPAARNDRRS